VAVTLPDLALGGGQQIVLNQFAHADLSRFDLRLVVLQRSPADLSPEFAATGIPIVHLDLATSQRPAAAVALARTLRRLDIDLVHTHGFLDRDLAVAACAVLGIPMVCHLHSEWDHRRPNYPDRPSALAKARARSTAVVRNRLEDRAVAAYLADSPAVAQAFAGRTPHEVFTLRQSVPFAAIDAAIATHEDAAWRRELGLGSGPVIANVSRLAPGKGHAELLEVLARVRAEVPDAQLLIAGDGELRADLQARSAAAGLAGAVHFLGVRRDLPRVLAGATAFAFASVTESFGLVVAEAMGARLPVVAMALPSLTSFTRDGVTGHFPAQGDIAAMATALVGLLSVPERARAMGEAGRRSVEGLFPADATATSTEAVYDWVLTRPADTTDAATAAAEVRGRIDPYRAAPSPPTMPSGCDAPVATLRPGGVP
jgi:glycosyltransferase involved in cell wall biosynthesis